MFTSVIIVVIAWLLIELGWWIVHAVRQYKAQGTGYFIPNRQEDRILYSLGALAIGAAVAVVSYLYFSFR